MALLREWGESAVVVKLDIRRAFDSLSRLRLAKRICSWAPNKPVEAANLIALLTSSEMAIHLPWSSSVVTATQGVRQGAPESPTLFAKIMECVLEESNYSHGYVFNDLHPDSAGYMDDLLLWKCNLKHMQNFLDGLLPRLALEGLHIQPPKCQLLTFGNVQGTHLMLQGFKLLPMKPDEPLIVMNAPMHPVIGDIDLLYFQINKARRKLFSIKHILQGPGRIAAKLKLLESVIFGSFRWMIGAVFPSARAQQALNAFHMYAVSLAMNLNRRPGELWVEYRQRAFRLARVCIFNNEATRWGTLALRAFWQYTGHRVRTAEGPSPTVASMFTNF